MVKRLSDELIEQWNPTKNGNLSPYKVAAGSNAKVWWLGECGHEWQATLGSRSGGRNCPICVGKKILKGFNDLASTAPKLALQWHPTKNDDLYPDMVALNFNKKVWWLGACGHEWEATPNRRNQGGSCPICVKNSFTSKYPELALQWHPTKNGELSLDKMKAGFMGRVWWLGECGHEWQALIATRKELDGCPLCRKAAKVVVPDFIDLASKYPEIAIEWHPTKNGDLTSDAVHSLSAIRAWWLGGCGHEWQASPASRGKNSRCPVCIGKGSNSLAFKFPDLSLQWHPTKNGSLTPSQVTARSGIQIWWLGDCGHEWQTDPYSRSRGQNCPTCAGRILLKGFNDLAFKAPTLAAQWHPTKNGDLTSDMVFPNYNKTVWWLGDCGHEWEATPNHRSQGSDCLICAGKTILTGFNDFASKFPTLALQWHPTKNGEIRPTQISPGMKKKVWWLGECGHEWEALVVDRVSKGSGCHYCSNQRPLKGFNDLESLYPEISVEWHPTLNVSLTPASVTKSSGKKVWWVCPIGHEPYYSAISHRTRRNHGCPKCGEAKVGILNGIPKTGQSFDLLYPHLLNEWHPNLNTVTPQSLKPGADVRIWWICDKGHEWEAVLYQRTGGSKSGCPDCFASSYSSQPEIELQNFLDSLGVSFISNDKKLLRGKELDIYIPDKKFAIEFNGGYWHTEEMGKHPSYHYDKWLACKEKGVQLIQIWEDEWSFNPEQIKHMISHKLGLSIQRKVFARKTQVIQLDMSAAKSFLDMNHVQGFAKGSHYLGLTEIDNSQSEILAVLVLEAGPHVSGNLMNIIRYATNVTLVGGFTELLSHATKEYRPDSYSVLADHSVSTGNLFASNGFIAEKEIAPDYMYFTGKKRESKENLNEQKLSKLTNSKRIWDAGKTMYVLDMKSKMK